MASSFVCRVGGRTFGLYHPVRAATTVGSSIRQNYSSVGRNVAGKRSMAVALSPLNSHISERVRCCATSSSPPSPPSVPQTMDLPQ
eukprot:scaffold57739_cov50-Attheya_sp.AAC.1